MNQVRVVSTRPLPNLPTPPRFVQFVLGSDDNHMQTLELHAVLTFSITHVI